MSERENRLVRSIAHNGDANDKPALIRNDGKAFARSGAVGTDSIPEADYLALLVRGHNMQEGADCSWKHAGKKTVKAQTRRLIDGMTGSSGPSDPSIHISARPHRSASNPQYDTGLAARYEK